MNALNGLYSLIENLPSKVAVVSPGSRNAPAIYLLHRFKYELHSVIDERSAGFIALGLAKSSGQPVVLNCTSGSAVVNYYPAITEAYYSRVPLIILTADRPKDDINQWEGQAIMQENIFHPHINEYFQLHEISDFNDGRILAKKVNISLKKSIPGPIQINIPIVEPFYSRIAKFENIGMNYPPKIIPMCHPVANISLHKLLEINNLLNNNVMVVEGDPRGEQINLVDDLSIKPVIFSDITTNRNSNIENWYRYIDFNQIDTRYGVDGYLPTVLITTGTTIINRDLRRFLKHGRIFVHFHVSHYRSVSNPYRNRVTMVYPSESIRAKEQVSDNEGHTQKEFFEKWQGWAVPHKVLNPDLEFSMVEKAISLIPENSLLFLGNSMAVRHASHCADVIRKNNLTICANRGVSGIDGCISTAIGMAKNDNREMFILVGDIAFLYELNSLLNVSEQDSITLIVINNQGGQIFKKIDGSEVMNEAISLMLTPHSYSFNKIADFYNFHYTMVELKEDLTPNIFEKTKNHLVELRIGE